MLDLPIGSPDWLSCAQSQLEEELSVEQRTQEEREQQLESCGEALQLLVDSIKTILSNHNRQLADVKHLLKAMAKVQYNTTATTQNPVCYVQPESERCLAVFTAQTAVGLKYLPSGL